LLIGVLALQGDFLDHKKILEQLGQKVVEVRLSKDLEKIDALILPGGESTTMSLLLKEHSLARHLKQKIKQGMPVLATCAGTILLSKKVDGKPGLLKVLDIEVKRNGYGRQIESFEVELNVKGVKKKVKSAFIRAPIILNSGKTEVLSSFEGHPVLVKQGSIFAATFHPEIENDYSIHELFLQQIK